MSNKHQNTSVFHQAAYFRVRTHSSKLPPYFLIYSIPGFRSMDNFGESFRYDCKHAVATTSSHEQSSKNQIVILFITPPSNIKYLTNSISNSPPLYPFIQTFFRLWLTHLHGSLFSQNKPPG
jgi:hypothetical protein